MYRFIASFVVVLFAACGNVETYSSGPSGSKSSQSPITTPQSVGGRCFDSGDCTASLRCVDSWPNGYCSQTCQSNSSCPTRSTCVAASGSSSGVCLANCFSSSDCRPGYECVALKSGGGVCFPE